MLIGFSLATIGIGFFIAAAIIGLISYFAYHTYHGNLPSFFAKVIIALVAIGAIMLGIYFLFLS